MQRHQNPSEHATPQIYGHGECTDQNREAGGSLQLSRYHEHAVELDGNQQPGGHDCQAYPQTDPESPGNRPVGLRVIFLRHSLGDETDDSTLQTQVEQIHVRHK